MSLISTVLIMSLFSSRCLKELVKYVIQKSNIFLQVQVKFRLFKLVFKNVYNDMIIGTRNAACFQLICDDVVAAYIRSDMTEAQVVPT